MIGTKYYKPVKTEEECAAYNVAVDWCNSTQQGYIEDKGDYYEVVAIPEPSLDEIKTNKIAELKSIRDTQEVADIQVNGYLYDYDEKARERINAAIIALDLTGGTITWTLADNTDKEVSANDLRFVIAMVAQRSNVLHTQYRHLKEAVNAATTVSEVESISWPEE